MTQKWRLLFSLFAFVSASACICELDAVATTESCGQLYIVNPPKSDGGTFYRNKTDDGIASVRKGYLPRGMVVKLVKQNGDVVEEFMKDEEAEEEFKYKRFVATDGSSGFIRSTFVKPLNELYPNQSKHVDCSSEFLLVLPISPTKEVFLYSRPKSPQEGIRKVHRFSRSESDLVVSRGEEQKIVYTKDGEQTRQAFFDAIFVQDQVDAWRPRSVIIPAAGIGKLYELIPLKTEDLTPVRHNQKTGLEAKIKAFAQRFKLKKNVEDLLGVFKKSCANEVVIEGELGVGTPSWFGTSASLSGKVIWKFPAGERYDLNRYENVLEQSTVEVDRLIHCQKDTHRDWYISRIHVSSPQAEFKSISIAQKPLLQKVNQYFTTPDANLVSSTERLAMLALRPKNELPSEEFFSAFTALGNYLEQAYLKNQTLSRDDKARLKSLLIRLVVDPNPMF
jgi:hypothetical protein